MMPQSSFGRLIFSKFKNNEQTKIMCTVAPELIMPRCFGGRKSNEFWVDGILANKKTNSSLSGPANGLQETAAYPCFLVLTRNISSSIWVRSVPISRTMNIQVQTDYFGFRKWYWPVPNCSKSILKHDRSFALHFGWYGFSRIKWSLFNCEELHLSEQRHSRSFSGDNSI